MSRRRAMLGAVAVGLAVTGVYHLFETVDQRDDLWFAGLAAGLGLVTVPLLVDLSVLELTGRILRRERHLPQVRMLLVVVSAIVGLLLVGWISARAGRDPYAGYAFVWLPILVFALGLLALIAVLLAGADEPQPAR